jgi:hypothetical protein
VNNVSLFHQPYLSRCMTFSQFKHDTRAFVMLGIVVMSSASHLMAQERSPKSLHAVSAGVSAFLNNNVEPMFSALYARTLSAETEIEFGVQCSGVPVSSAATATAPSAESVSQTFAVDAAMLWNPFARLFIGAGVVARRDGILSAQTTAIVDSQGNTIQLARRHFSDLVGIGGIAKLEYRFGVAENHDLTIRAQYSVHTVVAGMILWENEPRHPPSGVAFFSASLGAFFRVGW